MAGIPTTSMVAGPAATGEPTLGRRAAIRLRRSLPSLGTAATGAACWSAVMAASAITALWMLGWQTPGKFSEVALIFAVGGALAFPIGLFVARLVALGRSAETAFAAAFLALSLATIGLTAAIFAFDYRQYYATWHDETFTIRWVYEFVFTIAGALVQFAVLGARLYFPIGFVGLFLAAIWFARTAR